MNSDQFLAALASELPSERMRAVQWARENSLTPEYERVLLDAAEREGVPRIRAAISLAIKQFEVGARAAVEFDKSETSPGSDMANILDELSGIIRHEMQPAIGWVRFAANKEVSDFEASATNRSIEALRRRVNGLADLAAAHRLPARELISLGEALSECLSAEYPPSMFMLEPTEEPSDEILTDPGLLSLILVNAIQNAAEAARDLPPGEGQVLVTTNVNEKSFWLTISNRFTGTSFDYSSVSATGRTSKPGHRGLGTRITELAARRLGYEFELRATGATATFSLRGKRFG